MTIRGLNESVFRRFKAKALEEGVKLGEALTQALDIWVQEMANKREVSVLNLEAFD